MAYIKDLARCTYGGLRWRSEHELAVGWLSIEHTFPSGDFPAELLIGLASLAERPVNLFRGTHECDICPPAETLSVPPPSALEVNVRRKGEDQWVYMMGQRAVIGDNELELGNGEIQVSGVGETVYVAPTMIVHYIIDHHYLPPDEFIKALRVGRVPDLPPEALM